LAKLEKRKAGRIKKNKNKPLTDADQTRYNELSEEIATYEKNMGSAERAAKDLNDAE
jgi:hypothetical protein